MRWLRSGNFIFSVGTGLSALALVIHTFWLGSESDQALLATRVRDLQLLVIMLLARTGLKTVASLLYPSSGGELRNRQTVQLANACQGQLSEKSGEVNDVEQHIRQLTSCQMKAIEQSDIGVEIAPDRMALAASQLSPAECMNGEHNHIQLSEALPVLNNVLVEIYRGLAALCPSEDHARARAYLNQALSLSGNIRTQADIHYSLGSLLARQGHLEEAMIEVQTAFLNKSPELECQLASDTEEGGPLFELAAREPYARVVDDLLLGVTIGR